MISLKSGKSFRSRRYIIVRRNGVDRAVGRVSISRCWMTKNATKLQKIDPVLSTKISKNLDQLLSTPSTNHRSSAAVSDFLRLIEHCVISAESFLYGKVGTGRIVLYERTPVVRVSLLYGKKKWTLVKTNPLLSMINSHSSVCFMDSGDDLAKLILKMLPKNLVAEQMARIAAAADVALSDPKKVEPIRERLRKLRAADKESYRRKIRDLFSRNHDMLKDEEIEQLWRESKCLPIHEQ